MLLVSNNWPLLQSAEYKPTHNDLYYSDHKLAKKKDKKDLRKQRRRERLEEKDDLVEETDDRPPQLQIHVPDMTGQDIAEGTVKFGNFRTPANFTFNSLNSN